MAPPISDVVLCFKSCSTAWFGLYLFLVFLSSLPALMFHVLAIATLVIAVAYYRLPPPNPGSAHAILGSDLRLLDGSPAKWSSGSHLWKIAHRAAGLDAPENSLAAVRLCKKNGAKCVEFDVDFSADGVAVVFHDDSVDRMTEGTGKVSDFTLKELQQLDISSHHVLKDEYPGGERIPTLEAFVSECQKLGLGMIIDVKSYRDPEITAKTLVSLYEKDPSLYESAMVSSFFPHLIYAVRQKDPKIVCSMAWRPHFLTYASFTGVQSESRPRFPDSLPMHYFATAADVILKWALHNFLWYFLGLSAVLIQKDHLNLGYIQSWREKGVRVIAWTVNNSLQKLYFTNYLRVLLMSDTMDQVPESVLLPKEVTMPAGKADLSVADKEAAAASSTSESEA